MNCPICLESDNGMLRFVALLCGHVFHRQCICLWLTLNKDTKICPLCRKFADGFLNLYFFSGSNETDRQSINEKPVQRRSPRKRNKGKDLIRQESTHRYELRSTTHISRGMSPYWLRARRR